MVNDLPMGSYPAERNYDTTNREGLAVVLSIDYFRHYLEFDSFTLFIDHSALHTLQTFKNPTERIARWILSLQQFTFTIKHRPGKLHVNADAMTRPPVVHRDLAATYPTVDTPISSDASPIFSLLSTTTAVNTDDFSTQHLPAAASDLPESLVDRIRREQRNDPDILILIRYLEDGSLPSDQRAAAQTVGRFSALKLVNGIVYHRQFIRQRPGFSRLQLFVPLSMRPEVLSQCHDDSLSGHLGIERSFARLQQSYFWFKSFDDMAAYVKSCDKCQRLKDPRLGRAGKLQPMPPAFLPFESIAMDFTGVLTPTSRGNTSILAIVDMATYEIRIGRRNCIVNVNDLKLYRERTPLAPTPITVPSVPQPVSTSTSLELPKNITSSSKPTSKPKSKPTDLTLPSEPDSNLKPSSDSPSKPDTPTTPESAIPDIPDNLKFLRRSLTDIYDSIKSKTIKSISSTKSALKILLGSGSPFIGSFQRNKLFLSQINLLSTPDELVEYLRKLVTDFSSVFDYEIHR